MMENLINDLLDLAKVASSNFTTFNEYFSLPEIVYGALEIVSSQAALKKINLTGVIAHSSQLCLIQKIYGDKRRYLQFLINFLSNSLTFTREKGQVTVYIEILEHQEKVVNSI